MKKNYLMLCLVFIFGTSTFLSAQIDPGTDNLKHQWTFDDGTAVDNVGGLVGVAEGASKLINKAFVTTDGGFMTLPSADLALNTYPAITQEVWFTSVANGNTGFSMLTYFGNTTGSLGYDYLMVQPARQDNVTRTAISCLNQGSPWATESGANSPEYDDGKLHHVVSMINDSIIKIYIDGLFVSQGALSADNHIPNLSTALGFLCKGGYLNDPTWKGSIHKFSIYNKTLSDDEVMFLFQAGAEAQPVVTATVSSIALDMSYPAEMFNVSSSNLSDDITITAPEGIVVMPDVITKNTADNEVAIFWEGTVAVDGNVVLKSGSTEVIIKVKTADDTQCYAPLYPNDVNYVTDPGLNSLASFAGWGVKNVVNIVNEPENVYCGANAISVGNGVSVGSGSLDVTLTGVLEPNTTYRVKAMLKTTNGTFQLGVWGFDASLPEINNQLDTQGEWLPIDFTFTTGSTLGATQGMFINNYNCTGTLAYADNWEMYMLPDANLTANKKSIAFDPELTTAMFTVGGGNLTGEVTLTAPDGVLIDKLSITPNEENKITGDTVNVIWDGTTAVNGNIVVSGSGMTVEIPVKAITLSNTSCMIAAYPEKTNYVVDPYLNNLANFGGWGGRSLVSIAEAADSVYCGSHSGRIEGTGSMDVILTGMLKVNTQYASHAMVKTVGGSFQMGVWGYDALATGDRQDTIDTEGQWVPMTLLFATSDTLGANAGVFFNNYQRSGTLGYIDNWEIVELGPVGFVPVNNQNFSAYFIDGKLVAAYNLNTPSQVNIQVYNMQGALVYSAMENGHSGLQRSVLNANLTTGAYIVRLQANNEVLVRKLIK